MAKWFDLSRQPIRITERGQWLHGDQPLHPRVAALFQRSVIPEGDGSYSVVLGFRRHVLVVADTPYFVRSLRMHRDSQDGLRAVELLTSDDKTELLDPATLMQSPDHVLYCTLLRHGLRVPCRFQPSQYHDLALNAHEERDDIVIRIGDRDWKIRPYSQPHQPGPANPNPNPNPNANSNPTAKTGAPLCNDAKAPPPWDIADVRPKRAAAADAKLHP